MNEINYPIYNFFRHLFDFFSESCPILNKCFKINCLDETFNSCSCEKGICALGTQCKVSALVFNSIIGEPDNEISKHSFDEMEKIIQNMENNSYLNFCIAVNSVKPDFVGHRFNIICLKERDKYIFFRIQSYVNSYPFTYEELSYNDLKEQMTGFITIFIDNPNKEFIKNQGQLWKKFTRQQLSIGNKKPEKINVFHYYLYEIADFENWKNRILNNITNLLNNTKEKTNNLKENLDITSDTWFGDLSISKNYFQNIINNLSQTQSNLKIKMDTDNISKRIDVMFSNQRQNMSKYKKNQIFIPEFLENQPNFTKEVPFQVIPQINSVTSSSKIPIIPNLGQATTPLRVSTTN